jgi:drug/metabolite transporter (DMT)-like permease
MDNNLKRGSLEMVAAMLISGTIGWFVLMSGQAVVDVVFWRCLIGGGMLLLVCAALGLLRTELLGRRILLLAMLSGVAIVGNWLLLFASYAQASIAVSTVVYNIQPFMLVGLAALFLGERITWLKLGWLALAFVGMLAIVSAHGHGAVAAGNYLLGIALAQGAALLYAVAALLVKRLSGTPPHLIALIQLLTGALMLAPWQGQHLPQGEVAWASLVTLGVVHTGLMYMLLYGAIQKLPTALTGALSFIYPVAAILVDWLAFDHWLSALQWLGVAAILLAAAGMQQGWRLGIRSRRAVRV